MKAEKDDDNMLHLDVHTYSKNDKDTNLILKAVPTTSIFFVKNEFQFVLMVASDDNKLQCCMFVTNKRINDVICL